MRYTDNGCYHSVTATAADVREFVSNWPCSGLENAGSIWAQFDKDTGDLVDIEPHDLEDHGADPYAVSALVDEMKDFAKARLTETP